MENYWHISGEVVRIKDSYANDNGASVMVRTIARRVGNEMSNICEMCVTFPTELYKSLVLKPYMVVDMTGHFETQVTGSEINMRYKTHFIADSCKILKG